MFKLFNSWYNHILLTYFAPQPCSLSLIADGKITLVEAEVHNMLWIPVIHLIPPPAILGEVVVVVVVVAVGMGVVVEEYMKMRWHLCLQQVNQYLGGALSAVIHHILQMFVQIGGDE